MRVGIISGSGMYSLPGVVNTRALNVWTPFGDIDATDGEYGGHDVVHISRHGRGHAVLSNSINHRGHIWALHQLNVSCVIGLTACGAVDPDLELGSLVIFDDMHFISNRLPDGSLCTFFNEPGDPDRGHWVLNGGPYSESLQEMLIEAALDADLPFQAGGIYGHVDGPRFNTPAEIAQLAAVGVSAVSQTGGPETVLCGELEVPFALVGFVTDYANDVFPGDPTPPEKMMRLIESAPARFAELLGHTLPRIARATDPPEAAGSMIRLGAI